MGYAGAMRGIRRKFFYGWIIVFSCFVCASGYGLFYTIGVFFNSVRQEFQWSATLVSSIHGVHCIFFGFALPIMGRLSSGYGSRAVFLLCSFLIGLGFALCSQVRGIWDYYLYYGIASIGAAATTSLPLALVQRWFIRKRGIVVGLVSAGLGFGAMVYPILAGLLVSHLDWRLSYLIIGIAVGGVMLVVAAFIVDFPTAMGLTPYGASEFNGGEAGDVTVEKDPGKDRFSQEDISWTMSEIVRTKTFFVICVLWIFASMATHLIIIHLVPFAEHLGMHKGEAAALLGLIGGVSILSRIFGGFTSEKLGWKNTLIVCAFLIAMCLVWLGCSRTRWMIYVFVLAYGFLFGIRLTIIPGLIGEYFGAKSLTEIMSYFWSVAAFAGLMGPMVGGLIFDITGAYPAAFFIGATWYVIVGVLAVCLGPP
ncbi:MAG: MFS transporter [Deltaproteobacteria bacterium]|nr:MFS transporter [Deltaproteobacteria bacterium]